MHKHLLTFLLVIYGVFVFGQSSDIRLELKSDHDKVFLGERVVLTLRIWDSNIIQMMKNEKFRNIGQEQIDKMNQNESFNAYRKDGAEIEKMIHKTKEMTYRYPSALSYVTEIEPTDTGKIKIGPFKIEYQKKVLRSNEIIIQVLQKKEKNYLLFDVPSKFHCDSVGLIKIRSHEIDIKNLELKGSSFYKVIGQHNSKSTIQSGEKNEIEYTRSFSVKFTSKGLIKLSRDYLQNIPDSCYIEPVIVKIE